jgi:glyceraldehyde-3-phosphate dehydrogenase/erythrose-4-phosphate dehydrogenase
MRTKVAINGLGRIGRAILKLVIDEPSIELVAVNDLVDAENLAYLLRFDTVYGRYSKPVVVEPDHLVVAGRKLRTLRNCDPLELPWKELGVALVFECTGATPGERSLRNTSAREHDLSSSPRRRKTTTWERSSMARTGRTVLRPLFPVQAARRTVSRRLLRSSAGGSDSGRLS